VIGLDVKNVGVALHVESGASDVLCHDLFCEVEIAISKRSYQHMVFAVNNSEVFVSTRTAEVRRCGCVALHRFTLGLLLLNEEVLY
jgi:hypothetical protein